VLGVGVDADLPLPASFEATGSFVRDDDIARLFAVGPKPSTHIGMAQKYVDAGFDRLALINTGPDVDGFFDFAEKHLIEKMRCLEAAR
jgi:hypothetical protein